MSWFFKKIGTDKERLKQSVMEEVCPASVKSIICELVDDAELLKQPDMVITIESDGHFALGFGGACRIVVNQQKLFCSAQEKK